MVTLTHTGKRFELKGPRTMVNELGRKFGFTCSESSGIWYTGKLQIALSTVQAAFPLPEALDALSPFVRRQQSSRATNSKLEVYGGHSYTLEYFDFQRAGIEYASPLRACLIADEMGLGKTLQAIGVINACQPKRVAICSPASGKIMWSRALEAWLNQDREIEIINNPKTARHASINIFNYEQGIPLADFLDEVYWDLLIFDESHMLKNPDTQRTTALLGDTKRGSRKKGLPGIRADKKIFLSGTPIEKRPLDLWPIIRACDPDGLGSNRSWFETRYCDAKQGYFGWENKGASNLDELNSYLRGTFMVRRLKKDVLTHLPEKRRTIIPIKATGAIQMMLDKERYFYDTLAGNLSYEDAVKKLRNKQEVAFETMAILRKETALAKLPMAISLMEEILENGEKLVVFAYHKEIVNAIHKHFDALAVKVDGDMSEAARQAAVDDFQGRIWARVIVGTIPTMYSVYTLTAASTALFVELDWRATRIKQAEDRLHRIGQINSVLALHLVWDGSVDALMAEDIVKTLEMEEKALD